jgi:hypothetical protein
VAAWAERLGPVIATVADRLDGPATA